ncbi:MAG: CDP-alcohol phosphatidyltransferase family protein [Myxococcales bacterium]|nr:CDP-alcohol phosphatidyltransferase family protein [Myxococcales bacterium]MCB9535104.1 CDP-alcohol phosphatidyltransferase family protein [Myxococcales bacterium]
MLADVRRLYRESLKPADSLFNLYVARPPAALFVKLLAGTRTTPNQVTLVSLVIMLAAVGAFLGFAGPLGLWLGVALVELSYVFDCVDGQLARVTGRTSVVGAELDFLMDELKAYLLVAALAGRWHLHDGGGVLALWIGVATLAVVAAAISLTKFVRSREYAEATGAQRVGHGQAAGAARARTSPLWPIEMAARLISQYPQTLPIFALFGAMDAFLYAYGAVHLLYVGRTALAVTLKLGRFAPRPGADERHDG